VAKLDGVGVYGLEGKKRVCAEAKSELPGSLPPL